jgi:Leucine-rich repeat (LRR) protein
MQLELIKNVDEIDTSKEVILSNNKITSIPPEMEILQNLQYLDLSYNKITSIPPEIGNLKKLQHLYLANNQIPLNIKELISKLPFLVD